MKKNFLILVLLSTTISLPVIGAIGAFGEVGSNVMVVPNGNPGYRPAFGPMPLSQPRMVMPRDFRDQRTFQQQGPFFNQGQNSNDPFSADPSEVSESLTQVRQVLAKWKNLIDNNKDNPAKITAPISQLEKEKKILYTALTSRMIPQPALNEYLVLKDTLSLAQLRQYTKTLPLVEQGFVSSFKDVLSIKKDQLRDDKGSQDPGNNQPPEWYERRIKKISTILSQMSNILRQINNNPPPFLLTGIRESYNEGLKTIKMYEKFSYALRHSNEDRVQAFYRVLAQKYPQAITGNRSNPNRRSQNPWMPAQAQELEDDADDTSDLDASNGDQDGSGFGGNVGGNPF